MAYKALRPFKSIQPDSPSIHPACTQHSPSIHPAFSQQMLCFYSVLRNSLNCCLIWPWAGCLAGWLAAAVLDRLDGLDGLDGLGSGKCL